MRILTLPIGIIVLAGCSIGDERGVSQTASLQPEDISKLTAALQPNTLSDRNERVIFSKKKPSPKRRFLASK